MSVTGKRAYQVVPQVGKSLSAFNRESFQRCQAVHLNAVWPFPLQKDPLFIFSPSPRYLPLSHTRARPLALCRVYIFNQHIKPGLKMTRACRRLCSWCVRPWKKGCRGGGWHLSLSALPITPGSHHWRGGKSAISHCFFLSENCRCQIHIPGATRVQCGSAQRLLKGLEYRMKERNKRGRKAVQVLLPNTWGR